MGNRIEGNDSSPGNAIIGGVYYKDSNAIRIWINDEGVCHIRVLKRINFKALTDVLEKGITESRRYNKTDRTEIRFYISKSLYNEMSRNSKEVVEFCQNCMNIQFELILIER
ncbi:MAG: hypothetical protein OIN89_10510 [Candidatus Methanoperedens sp.]|jgi:hypothetical protein|nr:hypothetical protein [Candidatus Methanoperedens sp.]PKL53225.1 MAG: hypothetical protein CVV36_08200 [Candidatus Methanoperedenaceae archaeon HGW-Methanoperedenaceae-1]